MSSIGNYFNNKYEEYKKYNNKANKIMGLLYDINNAVAKKDIIKIKTINKMLGGSVEEESKHKDHVKEAKNIIEDISKTVDKLELNTINEITIKIITLKDFIKNHNIANLPPETANKKLVDMQKQLSEAEKAMIDLKSLLRSLLNKTQTNVSLVNEGLAKEYKELVEEEKLLQDTVKENEQNSTQEGSTPVGNGEKSEAEGAVVTKPAKSAAPTKPSNYGTVPPSAPAAGKL